MTQSCVAGVLPMEGFLLRLGVVAGAWALSLSSLPGRLLLSACVLRACVDLAWFAS